MAQEKQQAPPKYTVGIELSDEQWLVIAELFPEYVPSPRGGCPPVPPRPCLEGILWVLRSGARWKDLPKVFPSPVTCWRRLRDWEASGLWRKIWGQWLLWLDLEGALDWSEGAGDATFVPAVKGGTVWASLKSAKAPKSLSSVRGPACPQA